MYTTSELEIASYLKARGHRIHQIRPKGSYLVEFTFPAEAGSDVRGFLNGDAASAREFLAANHSLRALIWQIRKHQQGGADAQRS